MSGLIEYYSRRRRAQSDKRSEKAAKSDRPINEPEFERWEPPSARVGSVAPPPARRVRARPASSNGRVTEAEVGGGGEDTAHLAAGNGWATDVVSGNGTDPLGIDDGRDESAAVTDDPWPGSEAASVSDGAIGIYDGAIGIYDGAEVLDTDSGAEAVAPDDEASAVAEAVAPDDEASAVAEAVAPDEAAPSEAVAPGEGAEYEQEAEAQAASTQDEEVYDEPPTVELRAVALEEAVIEAGELDTPTSAEIEADEPDTPTTAGIEADDPQPPPTGAIQWPPRGDESPTIEPTPATEPTATIEPTPATEPTATSEPTPAIEPTPADDDGVIRWRGHASPTADGDASPPTADGDAPATAPATTPDTATATTPATAATTTAATTTPATTTTEAPNAEPVTFAWPSRRPDPAPAAPLAKPPAARQTDTSSVDELPQAPPTAPPPTEPPTASPTTRPSRPTISGPPAPTEHPPRADLDQPLGFRERGRLRRRARYLRHLREVQIRDLGGFVLELHRFGVWRGDLVGLKIGEAAATDLELRALDAVLSERQPLREVREAGIGGACRRCGTIHGSLDHFCAACGAPLVAEAITSPESMLYPQTGLRTTPRPGRKGR